MALLYLLLHSVYAAIYKNLIEMICKHERIRNVWHAMYNSQTMLQPAQCAQIGYATNNVSSEWEKNVTFFLRFSLMFKFATEFNLDFHGTENGQLSINLAKHSSHLMNFITFSKNVSLFNLKF